MTEEIVFNKQSLTKTQSKLIVEFNGEKLELYHESKNIDILYNVLAHFAERLKILETECEILKQKKGINKNQLKNLELIRDYLNSVLDEKDVVVDYPEDNVTLDDFNDVMINVSEKPTLSFKDCIKKYGHIDSNVNKTAAELKQSYYDFCINNNYNSVEMPLYIPIQFLITEFGDEFGIRTLVDPKACHYKYHIYFSNNKNDINDLFVVDDSLDFFTGEELYAYTKVKGIKCGKFSPQSSVHWMRKQGLNVYKSTYGRHHVWGKLQVNDKDFGRILSNIQTNTGKIRFIINYKGGIYKLYDYIHKYDDISKIFELFGVDRYCKDDNYKRILLNHYAKHYNFSGWEHMCNVVSSYDTWDEFEENLRKRINK